MARVERSAIVFIAVLGLLASLGHPAPVAAQQQSPAAKQLAPEELDKLLAPIALYPDQLLVQILIGSTSPFQIRALNDWLKENQELKGSAVQEAAQKEGFDPTYVALAVFPQVVKMMAEQPDWTKKLGEAFQADRKAVLESAQRLRSQAMATGNLQSTPQQEVTTQTTPEGTQVIVIQPANPQIIYVPQYNPQVVYTQPATQTIVIKEGHSDEAAAAAIGFTVGVIVGAASNPYYGWGPYWGPYYGGAGYWYAKAWDDYYDHREEMFEDWTDHRKDIAGERTERQGTRQEERTERQGNRQENQGDRTTRQEDRQAGGDPLQERRDASAQRQTDQGGQGSGLQDRSLGGDRSQRPSNLDSRGYAQGSRQQSVDRSGTRSSGFSGYGNGSSSRANSSRGRSSMSRGGGGRSGGGRRR